MDKDAADRRCGKHPLNFSRRVFGPRNSSVAFRSVERIVFRGSPPEFGVESYRRRISRRPAAIVE